MSNSWKKYGGTSKPDKQHTFTVKTLIADELLLRQKYSGVFEVLGSINVAQDIYGHGALQLFQGQDNILKLDISTNAVLNYDTYITRLFLGTNTIDYITGNDENGIGVNLPNGVGSYGTFEVVGRSGITHNFVASSPTVTSSSVMNRNVNDYGIRTYVTDNTSSIEFYNNDTITNTLDAPDAAIIYDSSNGGSLTFTSPLLQASDSVQQTYKSFIYNNDLIKTGNSLTLTSGYDASANTQLTIASSNGEGAVFTGGAFPFDTRKAMGVIGLKDNVYADSEPCIHMVTTNDLYKHKFTIGVNDYNPNSNYIFNINGKTLIKNGGEINNYLTLPIDGIRVIKSDSKVYLTGSPSSYETDGNSLFNYAIHHSGDGGINWNNSFPSSTNTLNHNWKTQNNAVIAMNTPLIHNTGTLHVIATNDSFIYITNNIVDNNWQYFSLGLFDSTNTDALYNDIVYIETYYVNGILYIIYKNVIGNTFYINCNVSKGGKTLQSRLFDGDTIAFTYAELNPVSVALPTTMIITQSKQIGDYLFITSSGTGTDRGIRKFKIDSLNDMVLDSSKHTSIYYNIDYFNSTIVAIGEDIISISTNDGTVWVDITPSSITNIGTNTTLRGLHIVSENEIYIVGDGVFIYFRDNTASNINDINYWNIITSEQLPQNGLQSIITDSNSMFIDVHKVDDENFTLTRQFQEYDLASSQNPITNFYYVNIPNLFNYETTHTLDICGNVGIDGNINISNKLYVSNDVSFNSKLFVENDVSINSLLNVGNNATFDTQVDIYGDVSMSAHLFVQDDVSLNSDINVKENAYIENTLGVHSTTVENGYIMQVNGRIYNPNGVVHQF